MAHALEIIEVLEFSMTVPDETLIYLSLLPNLRFLRIDLHYLRGLQMARALDALSTGPASLIRQIDIAWFEWLEHDVETCDQVDSKIAGLPLKNLLSVGLQTNIQNYSRLEPSFPRLKSKNLSSEYWFENLPRDSRFYFEVKLLVKVRSPQLR
ncbi:hypothetical protein DFH08DRAFT_1014372 [Mycena albidolilacea]|uniref:Uncharacterized protein n=1 Tax=Mycena albidolilacea TaxID=1033008 RepID=A0AAD6ZSQ3_9AGAR|nr:hypothetical protein DFH08DRAFT_1014372 [Mycena albidolilacea]